MLTDDGGSGTGSLTGVIALTGLLALVGVIILVTGLTTGLTDVANVMITAVGGVITVATVSTGFAVISDDSDTLASPVCTVTGASSRPTGVITTVIRVGSVAAVVFRTVLVSLTLLITVSVVMARRMVG